MNNLYGSVNAMKIIQALTYISFNVRPALNNQLKNLKNHMMEESIQMIH